MGGFFRDRYLFWWQPSVNTKEYCTQKPIRANAYAYMATWKICVKKRRTCFAELANHFELLLCCWCCYRFELNIELVLHSFRTLIWVLFFLCIDVVGLTGEIRFSAMWPYRLNFYKKNYEFYFDSSLTWYLISNTNEISRLFELKLLQNIWLWKHIVCKKKKTMNE